MESSEEEDFSDDDIADVFGESEDEFGGFNFTLPDNINWETDGDGSKTGPILRTESSQGI